MNNFLSKAYKSLIQFDSLGPKPEILIKNKPRYFSFLGLIFTLGAFAISIWAVSRTIEDAITHSGPKFSTLLSYDESSISINLQSMSFYMSINTIDIKTTQFIPIIYDKNVVFPSILNFAQNDQGFQFIRNPEQMEYCNTVNPEFFEPTNYNKGFVSEKQHLSTEQILRIKNNMQLIKRNL